MRLIGERVLVEEEEGDKIIDPLHEKGNKKKLLLAVRDAPDVKRLTWDRTKGVTSLPRIFR